MTAIVDLRERSRAHQLTAELQDLSIRVDEAQVELQVGVASSDLFMQIAAFRRIHALAFLGCEDINRHQRKTPKPASRSRDALHERRHP
jgi:hypothetical protein